MKTTYIPNKNYIHSKLESYFMRKFKNYFRSELRNTIP